ncbi:MAG: hypothetical protein V4736_02370 [Bdellovibrionota bacterium]
MKSVLLAALLFLSVNAFANGQSDDDLVKEAVADTSGKMKDPKAREALINHDAGAKRANEGVVNVVGTKGADELYGISAEIIPLLFKEGQTPEEAMAMLKKAQGNPAEFLKSLPPDVQKKIRDLAGKTGGGGSTAIKP